MTGIHRTISITIQVDVDSSEDVSSLSDDELEQKVWDSVEPERNELASEMKIAALKIMNGEVP